MQYSIDVLIESDEYVTLKQAAKIADKRPTVLRRAITISETLPAVKLEAPGAIDDYLIRLADLHHYLDNIPKGGKPFHKPKTESEA